MRLQNRQPRTPVQELFKEQLQPLGLSEQQSKVFYSLISSVAGQAVQTQLKLQEKHESVVRDLQAIVSSVLGLVQQQAVTQQALQ
jgi:ethanolamine utilization cobalamin adenosyltransferase